MAFYLADCRDLLLRLAAQKRTPDRYTRLPWAVVGSRSSSGVPLSSAGVSCSVSMDCAPMQLVRLPSQSWGRYGGMGVQCCWLGYPDSQTGNL